jgi:hypothetical protein
MTGKTCKKNAPVEYSWQPFDRLRADSLQFIWDTDLHRYL